MQEAMHKVSQCISKHLLEVNHKPEDNHKWNGSVNIARRKHNWYTRKEDILNGGNKQCLMLYEQDMNEEAYRDGSSTDLTSGTSDEKRECMGYDSQQSLSFSWCIRGRKV